MLEHVTVVFKMESLWENSNKNITWNTMEYKYTQGN
jgi:hypothetical protein